MTANLYVMIQTIKVVTEILVNVLFPFGAVIMAGFTAAVVREFFKMRKKEEAVETAIVEMPVFDKFYQAA